MKMIMKKITISKYFYEYDNEVTTSLKIIVSDYLTENDNEVTTFYENDSELIISQ